MSQETGLSSCCVTGTLNSGSPKGKFEQVAGRRTYVTLPKDGSKSKTILFITDIFGVDVHNSQILADVYAKGGFQVLIPDLFDGDAIPHEFLKTVEPQLEVREKLTVVQKATNTASTMATLGPWMIKHREGVAKPLIDEYIATLRKDPSISKIGVVGFCWGGRHAVLQAHQGSSVDAAVALHPSGTTVADYSAVVKPLSVGFGEEDSVVGKPTDIIDALSKMTDVPHEVRIYEKQVHGFAVRGDWTSEQDKKSMDEAAEQAVGWFQKYLS